MARLPHGAPPPSRVFWAPTDGDLFLYAAAQMGAEPARCLVVEDSIPGVAAARAAGMTVLGFTGGGHCGPRHGDRLGAEGAAAVFADMTLLPDLVAALTA